MTKRINPNLAAMHSIGDQSNGSKTQTGWVLNQAGQHKMRVSTGKPSRTSAATNNSSLAQMQHLPTGQSFSKSRSYKAPKSSTGLRTSSALARHMGVTQPQSRIIGQGNLSQTNSQDLYPNPTIIEQKRISTSIVEQKIKNSILQADTTSLE